MNMYKILLVLFSLNLLIPLKADDGYKRNPLIDVLNYTFRISLSDTNDIIYGEASISLNFRGKVSDIEFDLKNLRSDGKGMVIDSVKFSGCGIKWVHAENKLRITPESSLTVGSDGILKVFYHGIPADGLIISENKFGNRSFFSDNWPDRAANYLPCIDHPYDKAAVEFIIIAPSHYEVVASGYLVEESHLAGDMKLTRWKEDIPLATKVMAFGAAEFDFILAGVAGNVPVWSYVFKENCNEGYYDYAIAPRPVAFFSDLIGPYSYEKLANVQSKTIFGGLENAGCIFYSENSVTGKGRAEGLIAHETAHQWFGNSVTESDWHHIWLSEGFATYLTSVYLENNYGRERLVEEMKTDREQVIRYYLRSPRPVIDTTITNLMRLLSVNSYQKGAWVLHMLRHELGDESFWRGMRLFYEKFRNKNALTSDFEKVMEEVSGKELSGFFNQWLYVSGQPDLKITNNPLKKNGNTEIIIEQKQEFLYSFPLELLINSQEGEYRKSISISERVTRLTIKSAKINQIVPDPDVNLLFRQISE
jgi:aminopeptidase N